MEEFKELNFLQLFLPVIAVVFIIVLGVVLLNQHFQKNLFRQHVKQEELRLKHQQELLRSSIDAQEEMRRSIAQDLHDELGATLSLARMQILKAESDINAQQTDKSAALVNIRSLTESALSAIRRISHQLMPPTLEMFGLSKTLQSVQDQVNLTEGLYLDLSTEPDPEGLPWEISISVYRIVMELIQNTIKHAHAQHLYIVLQFKQDKLLLTYRDDGRGLPATPTRGLGLKNLEARVNALGGTYTLTGKKGFECIVSVPVSTNKS